MEGLEIRKNRLFNFELLVIKILFPYHKIVTFADAFDHLQPYIYLQHVEKLKFYVIETTPLLHVYCEIVQYPHIHHAGKKRNNFLLFIPFLKNNPI